MRRIMGIITREFIPVIPPMIFFFIAFSLILITQALVLEEYGIRFRHFGLAAIGALVVGKILLVVDKFRFVDRYPDKPLIYNVIWKTVIYNLAALVIGYAERIVPLLFGVAGFIDANRRMFATMDWPHFWMVHVWLGVLFFVYCSARELVRKIGGREVRELFFGAKGG